LPWSFLEPLSQKIVENENKTILKGHGFTVTIKNGSIFWASDVVDFAKKRYLIVVIDNKENRETVDKVNQVELPFQLMQDCTIEFDAKSVVFPLIIRNKVEGEEIVLKSQKMSVKKIVSSWQLSESEKFNIPLIQDRNGIIAIAGNVFGKKLYINSNYKIKTERTLKILIKGRRNCAEE